MSQAELQPEGLRARKKRELRRRIIETAGRLFVEQGYNETRVEEIASRLDISAATIFNYFGSKDGLLLEMAEGLINRFESLLTQLTETAGNEGLDGLDRLATTIELSFREAPSVNRRLYVELLRVTLPHEAGSQISQRVHGALTQIIAQAQQRGEIRADLAAEELADLIADVITGAFNNWLNDPRRPLSKRLSYGVKFLLHTVQTDRAS